MNSKELIRQLTSCPNLEVVVIIPTSLEMSGWKIAKIVAVTIDQKDTQTPVVCLMWEK